MGIDKTGERSGMQLGNGRRGRDQHLAQIQVGPALQTEPEHLAYGIGSRILIYRMNTSGLDQDGSI